MCTFDKLTTKFSENLNQMENAEHLRSELVDTLSHLLRTPLTSIKGNIDLCQEALEDEDLKEALDLIKAALNSTRRMEQDIVEILSVLKQGTL